MIIRLPLLALLLTLGMAKAGLAQNKNIQRLANGQTLELQPAKAFKALEGEQASAGGRYYFVVHVPANAPGLKALSQSPLRLLAKLGPGTYWVSSTQAPTGSRLQAWGADAAGQPGANQKLSRPLANGQIPAHARGSNNSVNLWVSLAPDLTADEARSLLLAAGYAAQPSDLRQPQVVTIAAQPTDINRLASLPFVQYVQAVNAPDQILNQRSRSMAAASPLQATGGRNLRGQGVVLGIGDDTDPSLHPDLSDRIINHGPGIVRNHGGHVTGTVGGAGIILPQRSGFATMARLVTQWFSGIWQNAATYFADYGMVVTNNSYGSVVNDCEYNGTYDLSSQALDAQAQSIPKVLHVFASGNDGANTCAPYPNSYGTVLNGYQSAKNVITVGRTDVVQLASASSSSGPTKDGRLKPEIVALGEAINSTSGQFSMGFPYYTEWGTSMAAPAVTGGLGLLYQRYRQLQGQANPNGALMKAILLNGARDLGTPGPDFRHGYGLMNLNNSLRMLENNTYAENQVGNGQTQDLNINVPAGVRQLKVMLYWHDQPAAPLAAKTLVNDLDLSVLGPNGTTLPLVLTSLPATAVTSAAVPGEDHTNNSEQVVLNTPTAGNYTLRVRGYDVAVNAPQAYALVYDLVEAGPVLHTPFTGESWTPGGAAMPISWDYAGSGNGTFNLEVSYDNGANWNMIQAGLPNGQRYTEWVPPAGTSFSTQVRMRITQNGTAESFTSGSFAIIPNISQVSVPAAEQCPGYFKLRWRQVAGADGYEIVMKQQGQMMPAGTTATQADTTYTISGLHPDSTYYASVRVIKNGVRGRHEFATERRPNTGNCTQGISDGDLALDSIVTPVAGRQLTSTALTAATPVQVRIRNLDDAAASAFTLHYSLNGGSWVAQPLTQNIAGLGTYTHNLGNFDFSAEGSYTLAVAVKNNAPDANAANDTFRTVIRQLPNAPISLASPFADGFETAMATSLSRTTMGAAGTTAWDFGTNEVFGRLRSRASSATPRSGSRSITLDVSKATPYVTNPQNTLTGTFNLGAYTNTDEVRFDFWLKYHGIAQGSGPQNKVWARGTDQNPWVEIFDLGTGQGNVAGQYVHSGSIELSDRLAAAGQSFSTSTQIRFGQSALYGAADETHFAGYSFDDVRLAIATNDVQVLAINTPPAVSCNLSAATAITITLRNSMNTQLTNVPVSYTINGGTPVTELVTLPANTTAPFTFITTANLGQPGTYELVAMANQPGDNVPENNSRSLTVVSQPAIASFPYLQDFENGPANWFTQGQRSSWQWGTPASMSIKSAASGTRAWKTNLAGGYNDNERSFLYSPCFSINSMTNPTLSFSMAYDFEDCRAGNVVCDATWVEYSYDGITWTKLGSAGTGTNWYDYAAGQVWMAKSQNWWHVASIPLPKQAGNIALRFVMNSDDGVTRDGIAIDDIHIYDNTQPIVMGPANSNAVTQPAQGSDYIHFADGGKLIASVKPNGNNLGSTEVKAWFNTGALRNNGKQYFANRNITIKPTNSLSTPPARIRFYFTDAEANEMRNASGCANCKTPADYTRLNITQYTDADRSNEDGSLPNNLTGSYNSILNSSIRFVPYDAGYYAEFDVQGFSEFWLTDGNADVTLPARWVSFDAAKTGNGRDALLQWEMANERQVRAYEVQVSANGANSFTTLSTLPAQNQPIARYQYLDESADKAGVRLYRIRQTDADGRVSYSAVRSLPFGSRQVLLRLYPNPVQNEAIITTLAEQPLLLPWRITDATGRIVMQGQWQMQQAEEKWRIATSRLQAGIYHLNITVGQEQYQMKLVKAQ